MDMKLRQVSRLLKRYDPDLFPKRHLDGTLGIMRKRRGWDFYRYDAGYTFWFAKDWDDLVIPVTDNWNVSGKPVDWGIEPIYWQMQKQDAWRDDGDYDRFCAQRAREKKDSDRRFKNEVRAIAYDLRKEFAQATNDINTSRIEKVRRF